MPRRHLNSPTPVLTTSLVMLLAMGSASAEARGGDPPTAPSASSPPPTPDPETRAREASFRNLPNSTRTSRSGTIPGLESRWPFDGLIDPPRHFPFQNGGQVRPVAGVEWRFDGDALVESFASGTDAGLGVCRRLEPDLDSLGDQARPCPIWQRDATESSDGRGAWSTAFVDCYEVATGGPWITVTHRSPRSTIEVHLVGFDETRRSIRSAGPPLPVSGITSLHASEGPFLDVADFDGNGSRDFLIGTFAYTLGIGLCHQSGMFVLTDVANDAVSVQPFESVGTGFLDVEADGCAEVLLTTFSGTTCLDGKHHDFHVTRLLGFQDLQLVDLRDVHTFRQDGFTGRFPAFEWYAFDPKNRFKPLLSPEMKQELEGPRFPAHRGRVRRSGT